MKTDPNEVQSEASNLLHPRRYNPRPCPQCGETMFGMPGGRDAHCSACGFKDPCCSDA